MFLFICPWFLWQPEEDDTSCLWRESFKQFVDIKANGWFGSECSASKMEK